MRFSLQQLLLAVGLIGCTLGFATYEFLLAFAFLLMVGIGAAVAAVRSGISRAWRRGAVYGFMVGTIGLLVGYVAAGLCFDTSHVANPLSLVAACAGALAGGCFARWGHLLTRLSPAWRWGMLVMGMLTISAMGVWLARRMRTAASEQAAVAKIVELGGSVWYEVRGDRLPRRDPDHPFWEPWRRRLGIRRVMSLSFTDSSNGRRALVYLPALAELRQLDLSGCRLRDEDLGYLTGLSKLEQLNLSSNKVTDEGLGFLARLPRLAKLVLIYDRITDGALRDLAQLKQLRDLNLVWTFVSEEGAQWLRERLPGTRIQHEVSPVVRQRAEMRLRGPPPGRHKSIRPGVRPCFLYSWRNDVRTSLRDGRMKTKNKF